MKTEERLKKAGTLIGQLRKSWVFVEGKRDKEALVRLGFAHVHTISGNLRQSCRLVKRDIYGDDTVFVLTDLDRRGDQLAKIAKDELEGLCLKADLRVRKVLAYALNIRYFEDAHRAYEELKKEGEKDG